MAANKGKAAKKAPSVNVKKGDTVKVIAGRDKGAEGKVIQVLREEQRVIVEGVNRVKKHTKVVQQGGRAGNTGGIITAEAPIHVSNVILVEGNGGDAGRLPPRRRHQAPSRRLDVRRRAQRPHLPQVRQGHLRTPMTDTATESEVTETEATETEAPRPRATGPRPRPRRPRA